jgi:serine/threonine-protein kinase HipA
MRKAEVKMYDATVGFLIEDDDGYRFEYVEKYSGDAVSITMPLKNEPYKSKVLFPFFDGLIPEGWLLEIAEKNWKVNPRDRMGLLLACCKDCIGAVSIFETNL